MSSLKICIIDDDPIYVFTVRHLLKSVPIFEEVTVYKDGKEAFEGLKAAETKGEAFPDLILLDLNMPVWDGWDFIEEFKKLARSEDTMVCVVSSSDHPDDVGRAEQHSLVHDVLLKPLTADVLKALASMLRPKASR